MKCLVSDEAPKFKEEGFDNMLPHILRGGGGGIGVWSMVKMITSKGKVNKYGEICSSHCPLKM
jgi:hypothetical protein